MQERDDHKGNLANLPNSRNRVSHRRMVDLDDYLIAVAQAQYQKGDDQPLPTIRETITLAVAEHLATVVRRLQVAGLTARPTGRRRPRNLDKSAWEALKLAEAEVALSQIELCRCCLVLAGRGEEVAPTQPCE